MNCWASPRIIVVTCILLSIFFQQRVNAQMQQDKELVKASLIANSSAIVPGKPFRVGVYLQMLPGWHTYWQNSGDTGLPTTIQWKLPPGFQASPLYWPIPHRFALTEDIVDYGYDGSVLLITEIYPPPSLNAKEIVLEGHVTWLACAETCVPGEANVSLTLPVQTSASPENTSLFEQFEQLLPIAVAPPFPTTLSRSTGEMRIDAQPGSDIKGVSFYPLPTTNQKVGKITETYLPEKNAWTIRVPVEGDLKGILLTESKEGIHKGYELTNRDSPLGLVEKSQQNPAIATLSKTTSSASRSLTLLRAILYGFIGGLILNLMPCVFPVISLKIFGFMQQAGQKRAVIFHHGLAFAAGVFTWFFTLATIIVLLQYRGHTANWAFQFQNPVFNFVIISVVFVFALNLLGVFEIFLPSSATTGLSQLAERRGLWGSFFQGCFATLLATPCTAPFLGAALGFAISQSAGVVFLIFASVALGLALPYLVLSAHTGWMRLIPRPGAWMERIKQLMAFPLLATAVWLLMVLGNQRGLSAVIVTLIFLLCLAFCCWMIGTFWQPGISKWRHRLLVLVSLIIATLGAFFAWPKISGHQAPSSSEIPWKPYSTAALQEALAAGKPVFVNFTADWCLTCKFNEKTAMARPAVIAALRDVVPFKADWTNKDPVISAALKSFGRAGVPFYLYYPAGKPDAPILLPELLTESIILKTLKK